MAKQSAGTLLFRRLAGQWQVLLVHASGNYNAHKPWSIPKGLPDLGESLETAARRETWEETGVPVTGQLIEMGMERYSKSGKQIHGFAGLAPADAAAHCASWEVDRAEFVSLADARKLLHPEQLPLLERAWEWLEKQSLADE